MKKLVKMRINKNDEAVCCECGNDREKSLELYDICIGGNVITICDECNDKVLSKTLSASCRLHERLKTKTDLRILRNRSIRNERNKLRENA